MYNDGFLQGALVGICVAALFILIVLAWRDGAFDRSPRRPKLGDLKLPPATARELRRRRLDITLAHKRDSERDIDEASRWGN